jgi:hypothetical protein
VLLFLKSADEDLNCLFYFLLLLLSDLSALDCLTSFNLIGASFSFLGVKVRSAADKSPSFSRIVYYLSFLTYFLLRSEDCWREWPFLLVPVFSFSKQILEEMVSNMFIQTWLCLLAKCLGSSLRLLYDSKKAEHPEVDF